jgi:hypothetical protein
MRRARTSTRVLTDGTPLRNQLLAALPSADYGRIATHLRLRSTVVGATLHEDGRRIDDVYFPNGGVFSVTNRMRDGALVEVATVGREGMLGVGVFLGDRAGAGRTMQQVPDLKATAVHGVFREIISSYVQATLLQTMQCIACNALHDVSQRCCRWLLQIHDRVDTDDFALKQEFLAVMLGVRRPTVTDVLRLLKETGVISTRYGRIRVLRRRQLEAASCECYAVICGHFVRLGLAHAR